MKNLLIVLSAICTIVLVLALKVLLVLAITYALVWVFGTIISTITQKLVIWKKVTPKKAILGIYQMPLTMSMTILKTN